MHRDQDFALAVDALREFADSPLLACSAAAVDDELAAKSLKEFLEGSKDDAYELLDKLQSEGPQELEDVVTPWDNEGYSRLQWESLPHGLPDVPHRIDGAVGLLKDREWCFIDAITVDLRSNGTANVEIPLLLKPSDQTVPEELLRAVVHITVQVANDLRRGRDDRANRDAINDPYYKFEVTRHKADIEEDTEGELWVMKHCHRERAAFCIATYDGGDRHEVLRCYNAMGLPETLTDLVYSGLARVKNSKVVLVALLYTLRRFIGHIEITKDIISNNMPEEQHVHGTPAQQLRDIEEALEYLGVLPSPTRAGLSDVPLLPLPADEGYPFPLDLASLVDPREHAPRLQDPLPDDAYGPMGRALPPACSHEERTPSLDADGPHAPR